MAQHTTIEKFLHFNPNFSGRTYPFFLQKLSAGFPSPAEDIVDKQVTLDEFIVTNKAATFFVQISGNSMINAGIRDGSIAVVDRSLIPQNNDIVVAVVNNEFLVKRCVIEERQIILQPENPDFDPITLNEDMGDYIWGVVVSCISNFR